MTEREQKIAELEAELEKNRAASERISEDMLESRKNTRKDALNNLRNARNRCNDAILDHKKADDTREACRAALCSCVIGQRDPDEVRREVEKDLKKSLDYRKTAEKGNSLIPAVAAFILAVFCAVMGGLFSFAVYYGTAVFLIAGILLMRRHRIRDGEIAIAEKHRDAILAKYEADDEDMIKEREAEFLELHRIFTEAEEKERSAAQYLESCRMKLEVLENCTLEELDFNGGSGEGAELTRLLSKRNRRSQELEAEIEKLKTE